MAEDRAAEEAEPLDWRTPLEEFEAFARHRIDTLHALGEGARLALYVEAYDLGKRMLREALAPPSAGERAGDATQPPAPEGRP